jgi:NitT/TauT family transport system ATP-binding protein
MSSAVSKVHTSTPSAATETTDAAPAHVDARDITVDFYLERRRQRVLHGINLAVPKGSLVSLIGPSGCGKSILLKVLASLIVPTEGRVSIDGIAPREAAKRRIVGLVFQDAVADKYLAAAKPVKQ